MYWGEEGYWREGRREKGRGARGGGKLEGEKGGVRAPIKHTGDFNSSGTHK